MATKDDILETIGEIEGLAARMLDSVSCAGSCETADALRAHLSEAQGYTDEMCALLKRAGAAAKGLG